MADRPLRPATDRRLGKPLPHQQANRTQAAPKAPEGFEPQLICGISPSFPGLSPTSGHVPTRYSPVRRCHYWPRDLHVLSMPPAFALSQDQTLRFIPAPSNPTHTQKHVSDKKAPKQTNPRTYPSHQITQHNQLPPQVSLPSHTQTTPHHDKSHSSAARASHPSQASTPLSEHKHPTKNEPEKTKTQHSNTPCQALIIFQNHIHMSKNSKPSQAPNKPGPNQAPNPTKEDLKNTPTPQRRGESI